MSDRQNSFHHAFSISIFLGFLVILSHNTVYSDCPLCLNIILLNRFFLMLFWFPNFFPKLQLAPLARPPSTTIIFLLLLPQPHCCNATPALLQHQPAAIAATLTQPAALHCLLVLHYCCRRHCPRQQLTVAKTLRILLLHCCRCCRRRRRCRDITALLLPPPPPPPPQLPTRSHRATATHPTSDILLLLPPPPAVDCLPSRCAACWFPCCRRRRRCQHWDSAALRLLPPPPQQLLSHSLSCHQEQFHPLPFQVIFFCGSRHFQGQSSPSQFCARFDITLPPSTSCSLCGLDTVIELTVGCHTVLGDFLLGVDCTLVRIRLSTAGKSKYIVNPAWLSRPTVLLFLAVVNLISESSA